MSKNLLETKFDLTTCRDCEHEISTYCESCPNCGRFYRHLETVEILGKGWITRIAWGVILGYFGIVIISFVFILLFFGQMLRR